MKVLLIGWLHKKNLLGLQAICKYLKYSLTIGSIKDIQKHDIIYAPSDYIDASSIPEKRFLFGPHFSVFPDNKFNALNNEYKNLKYLCPSPWCKYTWISMASNKSIPIESFPFPVNIEKFTPIKPIQERTNVVIYYKSRNPSEYQQLINFVNTKNINYKVFSYQQKYNESDFIGYLKTCKYGIVLDAHESQGFAIEEMLSSDVPLLVWDAKTMDQEYKSRYNAVPCTTISYWDDRCGEYFYTINELENTFNKLNEKINEYKPRDFILENLSVEKCASNFENLINSIDI